MKKTKLTISIILVLVACIPLLFSFVKIINWNIDNYNTKKNLKNLEQNVSSEEIDDTIYTNVIGESNNLDSKLLQVDFINLLSENSEVVGWICVPGTNINYPFVQHSNNSYYLNHSFDKRWNDAGWLFLDYRNDINELNANTIIYGHGRLDGTMLGSLRDTLTEDWFANKDNHVVKVSTIANNYLFEVFSIYRIKTTNDYLYNNFKTTDEYTDFLNKISSRSYEDFKVEVTTKDRIITLSTCYNNSEKLVLHAKLIKQQKRY